MKKIIVILFFSGSLLAQQAEENTALSEEMTIQDSIFFERGFNQCDLEYLQSHIAEDLCFYHDQSGFQDRDTFLENTRKYICPSTGKKPVRKVDANSLKVFPLYRDGVLYGVIQHGVHRFYLREDGKEDRWTSTARFTHVWMLEKNTWKLTTVLSYDHQDPIEE